MFYRLALVGLLAPFAAFAVAAPASAAAGPIKQINSGAGNGSAFTATLSKRPTAGNVIVITVAMQAATTNGFLEPDDTANVVDVSESFTAYQVPGAPFVKTFGTRADPNVQSWGFHGVAQPVAWQAVELSGIQTFQLSGAPVWDGGALASNYVVDGTSTTLSTGHRYDTAVPHEFILAGYASRVDSGTPPTVTGFTNTYAQPGTWTRLGSTVVSGPVRLDVAYKVATQMGSYDCTATWSAPPAGMAASLTPLYAV